MNDAERNAAALEGLARCAETVRDRAAYAWDAARLTLEGAVPALFADAGGLTPADAARLRELSDRAEGAAWEWGAICTALWDMVPEHASPETTPPAEGALTEGVGGCPTTARTI